MTSYEAVQAELDRGTPAELLCATCPWDRLCVQPPEMSKADIDRKLAEAEEKDRAGDPAQQKMPMGMILTALTYSGKAGAGKLCPVFALRLRGPEGRQVADGIRSMMRDGIGGGA